MLECLPSGQRAPRTSATAAGSLQATGGRSGGRAQSWSQSADVLTGRGWSRLRLPYGRPSTRWPPRTARPARAASSAWGILRARRRRRVERRALLAIDRIGQQPLFHTTVGGTLVFSTTADGLRGHPDVRLAVSPQGIYDYLYCHICRARRRLRGRVQAPGGALPGRTGRGLAGRQLLAAAVSRASRRAGRDGAPADDDGDPGRRAGPRSLGRSGRIPQRRPRQLHCLGVLAEVRPGAATPSPSASTSRPTTRAAMRASRPSTSDAGPHLLRDRAGRPRRDPGDRRGLR